MRPTTAFRSVLLAAAAACVLQAAPAGAANPGGASAPTPPAGTPKQPDHATPRPIKKPAKAKPAPKKPKLHGNAARADAAYQAMQQAFYVPSVRLYRGTPYSFLWGYSQALAATVSAAMVPSLGKNYYGEVRNRIGGLAQYWDPVLDPPGYDGEVVPPLGKGGVRYFDDNEWVGLELLRIRKFQGFGSWIPRARAIFSLVTSAWDDDMTHSCPGGIPFADSLENGTRNAVTTAPGAELAVQLYRLTRDPAQLVWAKQMYAWVHTCLLMPNGLYADHIGFNGKLDPTTWSYVQGAMIGAGVMLYQATGDPNYLSQARATASHSLAHFGLAQLLGENPFFVSVFARNLLLLDSVRSNPAYRGVITQYANYAWDHVRTKTNLFPLEPGHTIQLLDQAAMVQIYSLLGSSAATYF